MPKAKRQGIERILWAADEKRRMAETKKGLRNGKISDSLR